MSDQTPNGSAQVAGLDVVVQAPGARQARDEAVGALRDIGTAARENADAVDRNTAAFKTLTDAQREEARQAAISARTAGDKSAALREMQQRIDALVSSTTTLDRTNRGAVETTRQQIETNLKLARAVGATEDQVRQLEQAEKSLVAEQVKVESTTGAAAAAHGVHGLQLGRLNMEIGTFIGRLTGANTAVTRLGAMVGGSVFGYGQMILVLAGVAAGMEAISFVWKRMASDADEFAKKVTEAMKKVREETTSAQLAMGDLQLAQAQKNVVKAQQALIDAQAGGYGGASAKTGIASVNANDVANAKKALDQANADLMHYQAQKSSIEYQMRAESERNATQELATLITSGHYTEQERRRAIELYRKDLAEIDELGKSQTDNVRRMALIGDTETLEAALFPKEHAVATAAAGNAVTTALLKQLDAMRKVNEENNVEAQQTAAAIALKHADAEARELLANQQRAEMDRLKAYHDLSGVALTDRLNAINSTEADNRAEILREQTAKHAADAQKLLNEFGKEAIKIAEEHEKATNKQAAAALKANDAAQTRLATLKHEAREFQQAIDGAVQLAESFGLIDAAAAKAVRSIAQIAGGLGPLLKEIQGLGKIDSKGNNVGSVGGIVETALPLAGALGALTSSLLGGGAAARQRKEAEDRLRESLVSSLNQMRVQAGVADDLSQKLLDSAAAFKKLRDDNDAAYAGLVNQAEREQNLAEINRLEQIRIQQLKEEAHALEVATAFEQFRALQDVRLRLLHAQGLDDEATKYQQLLEVQDAINAGRSDEYVATLKQAQALENEAAAREKAAQRAEEVLNRERQASSDALTKQTKAITDALNAQTKIAQDQLRVAQSSHDDTSRALNSLRNTQAALTVGEFSVLGPQEQLTAARQRGLDLFRQAQLGDKTAAGQFGDAETAYLKLAQGYYGTTKPYTDEAAAGKRMVDSLVTQYGVQETIDQRMLDTQTQQVDLLTRQITAVQEASQQISDAIRTASIDQIPALNESIQNLGSVLSTVIGTSINGLATTLGGAVGGIGITIAGAITTYDDYVRHAQAGGSSYTANTGDRLAWAASHGDANAAAQVDAQPAFETENAAAIAARHAAQLREWMADHPELEFPGYDAAYFNATSPFYGDVSHAIPAFATGGDHRGGIMQVHANELVATGPARVFNAGQTADILASAAGAGKETVAELREQNRHLEALVRQNGAGMRILADRLDTVVVRLESQETEVRRKRRAGGGRG